VAWAAWACKKCRYDASHFVNPKPRSAQACGVFSWLKAMQPIRIYLDSSDYSSLSDRSGQSTESANLFKRLLDYADCGSVAYYFSAVHISEMSPLENQHTELARERGETLTKLCKRNCFISLEQIWEKELGVAHGLQDEKSVYSMTGDWFPEDIFDISPFSESNIASLVNRELATHDLNRSQRREAKRKFSRNGKLRKEQKAFVQRQVRHGDYQGLLAKYPMREQDAKLIGRYLIGDGVSKSEAENAYLESLRDPTWMMQWFSQHHDLMLPIVNLVRGPARTIHETFKIIIHSFHEVSMSSLDSATKKILIRELNRKMLISLPNKLSDSFFAEIALPELSEEVISKNLQGIKSMISLMFESLQLSLAEKTPRVPKLSDAVDAMHAVHMPYVDIFRADTTMAPLLEKEAIKYGTKIVARLAQLPEAIERELTSRS
jgi:hypothetical protein